ncbi:NfeD family protein [Flavimaricola marinus]|uniref:NfeD-like C-terminal domain-containing protein n=1 Tax=Flavimaricola marinus TaxID=1819565 RepID=A0A238LJ83_9RHOB|nr:hypothetical protein [Flavimaricola marinus]SMY09026.1 hypothetical protein LOM8899_03187 [Flavimaricola marinus]
MMWSAWWVWMAAALVLGILEILVPAYIFFGFALGAFAMGLLMALGVFAVTGPWALVLFAVLSLIAYVILRRVFGLRRGQVKIWDRDINDN